MPMLSLYSSRAKAALLALLPDLGQLLTEKNGAFEIATKTPAGWDFWVSSEDEQLTVGFAEYHCHFGNFLGTTPENAAAEASKLINALRTGELVLAVQYRGGEYISSWLCLATDASLIVFPTSEKPFLNLKETLQVRKWAN